MKQMYLAVSLLVCIATVSAQQKLGIATYTVPAGWQVSEQKSSSVMLESKTKNGVCKITIFITERASVSSTTDYTRFRDRMGAANITYNSTKGSITKNEANGIVSFSSYGFGSMNGVSFRNHFYSFSNGIESCFVQLSASDNTCILTFNTFLTSLLIDPAEDNNAGGTNTRRRKKAAPAAVPAAPAPMM
jgi:hypothetical protein